MSYNDEILRLQKQARADPVLSQLQTSRLLGVSISTLFRLRKAGTGPKWMKFGGSIKYRTSAVLKFIEDAEIGPQASNSRCED